MAFGAGEEDSISSFDDTSEIRKLREKLKIAEEFLNYVMLTRKCKEHKLGDCPSYSELNLFMPCAEALKKLKQ